MRSKRFGRTVALRGVAVAAFCFLLGPAGCGRQERKAPPPSPLPNDVVWAWEYSGATLGWTNTDDYVGFARKERAPGADPAFTFKVWRDGVIPKLPAPAKPFGLFLASTSVTDAGLKDLAGLRNLHTLGLFDTQVTDAGLKELVGLTNLRTLDLGDTYVTDAGLKELAGLSSLQTLNLRNTHVSDAGLRELSGLKDLKMLDLAATHVTDAGLKVLAAMKDMQYLTLLATRMTDLGLKELAGLKNLKLLDLRLTQVTDAGVAELQRALPECRILH